MKSRRLPPPDDLDAINAFMAEEWAALPEEQRSLFGMSPEKRRKVQGLSKEWADPR